MFTGAKYISMKSRLTLTTVLLSTIITLIVGMLGWQNGKSALTHNINEHLTTTRAAKVFQIENYFEQIFKQSRSLSENEMMIRAMKQFQEAFASAADKGITPEQDADVTDFYEKEFVPALAKAFDHELFTVLYRPITSQANYFQYHYLVNNPFPVGKKDGLVDPAGDTSIYRRYHHFYHPIFSNLNTEFSYYDILLVDINDLNIVYSVAKETDFATNLVNGPYSESGIGTLVKDIQKSPERGKVLVSDFRFYAPSYGTPAAYVATPIFDGTDAIGILVIQLSLDNINSIMTYNNEWESHGHGKTGESFLVGPDHLMRSESRLYLENVVEFLLQTKNNEISEDTQRRIRNNETTILSQPVIGEAVELALNKESGNAVMTNYLGNEVLSSYAPVNIVGLDWVLLSEINTDEAFAPIDKLKRRILTWGSVLVLTIAFFASMLSRYFIQPVDTMAAKIKAINDGDLDTSLATYSSSEYGKLSRNLNILLTQIQQQKQDLEVQKQENTRLLNIILPPFIARRMQAGESVADHLNQVSVAYMQFSGFLDFTKESPASEAVELLSELQDIVTEIAEENDIQVIRAHGLANIATCGTVMTRLDHSRGIVDFSIACIKAFHTFNSEHASNLGIRIGVDAGSVYSAIVGNKDFSYEIWGETATLAERLHKFAEPNRIVISKPVYDRLSSQYQFQQLEDIVYEGNHTRVYEINVDKLRFTAPKTEWM